MSKNVLGRLHVLLTAESADFDKKMSEVANRLKKTGESIAEVGKTLTTKLTAPILAMGGVALKMGGDFESSMNQVKAVTGATGDEFVAMSEQAKLLGRTTQFSASQAADAMYFLASAGFDTTQVMQAMPGVLDLAAAANMDLARATDIASNILSGYGLEVEELARVNDVLVKTFQKANVNVEMVGESMKFAAPVANAAGIAFEEAAAMIGLFGNAGIQGGMAGTALRGTISRLLNPVGEAAEVIQELGIQTKDSSGQLLPFSTLMEQLESKSISAEDAMRLFGQEAGPAMMSALSQGSDALKDLTQELMDSGGTAKMVGDVQMQGFAGSIKGLKSAFEGLMIAIFESGLGVFATQMAARLTAMIQRATELSPRLVTLGVVFAGVAAAIGPVLFVVGKFITVIPTLTAGLAAIKGALALVAGAFLGLNPVTLAIMAVVGVLTATWILFGDQIKEIVGKIIPPLVNVFKSAWNMLSEFVLLVVALGKAFYKNVIEPFLQLAPVQAFLGVLGKLAAFIANYLITGFVELYEKVSWVLDKVGAAFKWLRGKIEDEEAPAIAESTGSMFDGVAPAAEDAADAANAALGGVAGRGVNARVSTNIAENVIAPLAEGAEAGNEALVKAAEAAEKAAEAMRKYDQALMEGARLQTLTGGEMLQLQRRAEELAAVLASGSLSLEERNRLTNEYNALEKSRLEAMGVNRDTLRTISTAGMDVSQKLTGLGVQVTAMSERASHQVGILGMFGQSLGNAGDYIKASFQDTAMSVISKFTPMGLAAEVIGQVMEKLRPAIVALEKPLEIVATVLSAALMPILKALFPVFKLVAIAATYVGEILFRVSQGIAWAVGNVIKAIGFVVSKIPFMGKIGENLQKFGQGVLDVADGYGEAADALKQGRKDISELTWPEEDLHEQTNAIKESGEGIVAAIYDTAPVEAATPAGMALEAYHGSTAITIGDVIVDAKGAKDPQAVGDAVAGSLMDMIDQALGYQVSRDTRLDGEMALI
jgi:TP901 family phage tail tape measure protein